MNINLFYFVLLLMLILISLGLNSLILYWMILELSVYMFLPCINNYTTGGSSLALIKYYISQTPAAMMFLLSVMTVDMANLANLMISLCMLFKLGVPPFHSWMVNLILELDYYSLLIMITVMKLIPMMILTMSILQNSYFNYSMMMFLFIICTWMHSINSVKLVIVLSSIFNTYWTLFSFNNNFWIEYFLYYCFSVSLFMFMISEFSFYTFTSISLLNQKNAMMIFILLMNLSGLPPFMGFFFKMVMISKLILWNSFSVLLLVLISLTTVYLYIQLTMLSMLNKSDKIHFQSMANSVLFLAMMLLMVAPFSQICYFLLF